MASIQGNSLNLGEIVGRRQTLILPADSRDKHLYICGATGTGKSKFLENLIRQDIIGWRRTKCGLLLLDHHGSLYDSLIAWLAQNDLQRPIIPIDLRRDDWVVSYNVLRKRKTANTAVIADAIIDAIAHVWGQSDTKATPLFNRIAGNLLHALYENNCTLPEARYLIDDGEREIREALVSRITDETVRGAWETLNNLRPAEFVEKVSSTLNRLQRFVTNPYLRSIFGQPDVSLDLGTALDEGAIILVSLATAKARVSSADAEMFGTLLLSDLWTAARERGKTNGIRPFYLYIDEFQKFITPTIAENLDEARGFGLHLTMANQFPGQLLAGGEHGERLFNSVMENASSKVCFRLSHDKNLEPMAKWLYMGLMNPDEVKHELYSTKVMGYREEYRRVYSRSESEGESAGCQTATSRGSSMSYGYGGMVDIDGRDSWSESYAESFGDSTSESKSSSHSITEGTSDVPTLIPVLGKELSHVQFRSLEEQLFRSMAVLFDQEQRQSVARLVGMRAPVSLFTPFLPPPFIRAERVERYRIKALERTPFALRMADATKRLACRDDEFASMMLQARDEPPSARRRVQ